METMVDKPTQVGLGFATHPDAFQCGREAAQQAKNQLPEGRPDLVLILGPGTVHFKDFVEGVRLVMGEETLIAVPCNHIINNETPSTDAYLVAAIQCPSMKISLAADETTNGAGHQGITSILSQFRRHRGNARREFNHRGSLVFSHQIPEKNNLLSHNIAADMGLESWLIGASTYSERSASIFCTNKSISRGLLALEFLSHHPFGLGSVAIGSFSTQPDLYGEALKTAIREASQQMQARRPCFGIVFFDLMDEDSKPLPKDILAGASAVLPQVPLIGISSHHHFVRRANRATPTKNDTIVVLLVPS